MQDIYYIREITETGLSACENADSFLQSSMWGEFKSRFGWKARAFFVSLVFNNEEIKIPLLVLTRRLLRVFSFAYVPWGPELPKVFPEEKRPEAAAQLSAMLKPLIARNAIFIRFDFPWFNVENQEECSGIKEQKRRKKEFQSVPGFKKAAAEVQPPDTVIINLDAACEEILAQMKPKWRYNISLAAKKGVNTEVCGAEKIEIFYSLLKETAARDGLAIHKIDYYKTLFDVCAGKQNVKIYLYLASHDSDVLGAIAVLFRGSYATYLYGASSNKKRNLMASYALQWKAMRDAKDSGCVYYDLFGIPPYDDPNHPMEGLYRFKTGFGGSIIHRPGSWDYPYKKPVYGLFNIAERFRKKIFNLKKTSRKDKKR
ncbi:MAG: peptidoglycan bridge formation glycyltransferase FemA/FemB family protein [Treponema sp.]|nr:peptidoglycan bridge formation glycyltransferase FemA/FemB family protein [Treponema sp.]